VSLDYLTFDELADLATAQLRNEIPTLDPTIPNSWAKAFVVSMAALAHSNNLQIRDLENQLFPQTATDEFLDRWPEYEGVSRNPATGGRGNVTITGTSGETVPALELYSAANGLTYESQEVGTIAETTLNVSSLTRSGTTTSVVFTESHGLASNNTVTIAGADQTDYNGDQTITVLSETEFTYEVLGSPVTPATGTITSTSTYATVLFECTTQGSDTNLDPAATLTIVTPITNVDDEATVGAGGLTGGADIEDDESARSRLFLSRSSRAGVFTADQIKLAAFSINGNTRVFVVSPESPPVSGGPVPGQVFIYFLRDNDSNPLPSSTLIDETKAVIISDGAMPAHTAEQDVVVQAPVPITTNYIFTAITPDTATMREAIEAQINAFYQDTVQLGEDILKNSYLGAISNTYDSQTGDTLQAFSLAFPSSDITVGLGQIGFPGTVSFAI